MSRSKHTNKLRSSWGNFSDTQALWASKVSVEPNTGCWLWEACTDTTGYGLIRVNGMLWKAHRLSYVMFVKGSLVPGLHIHHLCEVKSCVNPEHLEQVTPQQNTLASDTPARRNSLKTRCKYGHAFTPENTLISSTGYRRCRECKNKHNKEYMRALRSCR